MIAFTTPRDMVPHNSVNDCLQIVVFSICSGHANRLRDPLIYEWKKHIYFFSFQIFLSLFFLYYLIFCIPLPHPLFCPRLHVLSIHSPCFNQDTINKNFCRKKIIFINGYIKIEYE